MSRRLKNKPKIAIIRSLGVRIAQAEFASKFKRFTPYLAGDLNPAVIKYAQQSGLKYKDIPLKPAFPFDPVKILLGKVVHQSWVGPDKDLLESFLKAIDIFEIYEAYFFYSRYASEIAAKQNKPLITEIWTSFPGHPAGFIWPYSVNVKRTIAATDLFILRSHRALDYLKPFRLPAGKKEVIYHGVNLKRFYPAKKEKTAINILFAGTLTENKGLGDILKIFPGLFRKHKNIKLTICGQGPLRREVERLAKIYPVKYVGQIAHQDMGKIYREADIFCGPSRDYSTLGIKRWEEFVGYVFMEALASGLPIVTTDSGGIPEIVGKDNIVVPQKDSKALIRALTGLISDAQARRKIGVKNRIRAEKLFDLDRQVAQTEQILLKRFF